MLFEQGLKGQAGGGSPWLPNSRLAPQGQARAEHLQAGAAPHMDLWDPRPELNSNNGKAVGNRKLLASPFNFKIRPKRSADVRDLAEHRPARR